MRLALKWEVIWVSVLSKLQFAVPGCSKVTSVSPTVSGLCIHKHNFLFHFVCFLLESGEMRNEKETQRSVDLTSLENLKIQLFLPKCNKLPTSLLQNNNLDFQSLWNRTLIREQQYLSCSANRYWSNMTFLYWCSEEGGFHSLLCTWVAYGTKNTSSYRTSEKEDCK